MLKRMVLKLNELIKMDLPISESTRAVIIGLSEQRKDHSLRYEVLMDNGKETFTPPNTLINETLNELLSLTRIATHGK